MQYFLLKQNFKSFLYYLIEHINKYVKVISKKNQLSTLCQAAWPPLAFLHL